MNGNTLIILRSMKMLVTGLYKLRINIPYLETLNTDAWERIKSKVLQRVKAF